jgi:transposase
MLGRNPGKSSNGKMTTNELFAQALPLVSPWMVAESRFEGKPKKLLLTVELEKGTTRMDCPCCGKQGCLIHDRRQRSWRHLNFWQYETELTARVPRVRCEKCGVHQVKVPWAREGSGFTLLFEAMALKLIGSMSVLEAARIMGEEDTRIWRIVHHYVDTAYEQSDWSEVERIAVDETSRKKGHQYVTNVIDLESGSLLFMTPGKDAETIGKFVSQLVGFHGKAENIKEVAMDMSEAFKSGVSQYLKDAEKVFDRFHVMKLTGEAFDEVRKEVSRENGGFGRDGMWALRGDRERLSESMQELRDDLIKRHRKLARAMDLRELLRDLWNYGDKSMAEEHFDYWYSWARRCRLEPFKKLAKTLKEHWDGILAYYDNWTTSAAIEALNRALQLARKRAFGYRSFKNFRAIAYWIAGDLQPAAQLPEPLPQQF